MRGVQADLRHATATLRKRPGFAAVVVITLGLGIAATSSVFAILEPVVLRPLPYEEPERLVVIRTTELSGDAGFSGVTMADYVDLARLNRSFQTMAATYRPFAERRVIVEEGSRRSSVPVRTVTPGFFRTLGMRPRLGRTFTRKEAEGEAAPVVLVSHGAWRRLLAADSAAVGRTLRIDGRPHRVVGVLPDRFEFELGLEERDLWLPLAWPPGGASDRDAHLLEVVARLRPGATMASATSDVERIGRMLATEHPETNAATSFEVQSLHEAMVGDVVPALRLLGLAAALVLLVACANVSVLLLARTDARRREIAVRTALGAAPARIARLIAAESLLLALAGGAAGLALGVLAANGLVALSPVHLPRLDGIGPDWPLAGFTLAVCVAAGLLAALLPVWKGRDARSRTLLGLRGVVGTPGGGLPLEKILVGFEAAMLLVLLSGAFLAARSLSELLRVDPGFDPRGRTALTLDLPGQPAYVGADGVARFLQRTVDRLEAVPGVRRAGAVSNLPLNPAGWSGWLYIQGREAAPSGRQPVTDWELATPGYFEAVGIPLLRGRAFRPEDTAEAPLVTVVNETMARRWWPEGGPIGAMVNGNSPEGPWRRVVGVVGDVKQRGLGAETRAHMYIPVAQSYGLESVELVLWTERGARGSALTGARSVVREMEPGVAIGPATPLEDLIGDATESSRFHAVLLGLFGATALLLGLVGMYGVVSHWVSRRTREIGLRVALGARRGAVLRLVMTQGLLPAAAGGLVGIGLTLLAGRLTAGLFYGVRAHDPVNILGVALVLLGGAGLASFLPALRAARLDPAEVIKK